MNKLIPMAAIIFSIAACSSTPEVVENEEVVVVEDKAEGLRHDQMTLAQAQVAEIKEDEKPTEEEVEEVTDTNTEQVVEAEGKIVYPTTSLLNLRSGHGMSFDVVKVVKFGEKIEITDEVYGDLWLKTIDGLWVSKLFVSDVLAEKPNDPAVEIEDVAQEVSSEEINTPDSESANEEVSESQSEEVSESQSEELNNDSATSAQDKM